MSAGSLSLALAAGLSPGLLLEAQGAGPTTKLEAPGRLLAPAQPLLLLRPGRCVGGESSSLLERCGQRCACGEQQVAPSLHRLLPSPPPPTHAPILPGLSRDEVVAEVSSMRWGDFKPRLTDALVRVLGCAPYHPPWQPPS